MKWQRICKSFLAGVAFMAASGRVSANDCGAGCGAPACGSGCGPTTIKVNVTEWVTEQVPVTRTTYKTEWREETRQGTRTEYAQECRQGTRTVNRLVTETENVTRTYTVRVPYTEQRQGVETLWVSRQVTETVNVSVDRGHYETVIVPVTGVRGSLAKFGHKLKGGFGGHGHGDCCDPCACACVCEYVPTECKKVWCPCIVCEQKCCTRCVKSTRSYGDLPLHGHDARDASALQHSGPSGCLHWKQGNS